MGGAVGNLQVRFQKLETPLHFLAPDAVHCLPVNGGVHQLGDLLRRGTCEESVLQPVDVEQGFKAGRTAPLVPQTDKGFVENNGKDGTVEGVGDEIVAIADETQPLSHSGGEAVPASGCICMGQQVLQRNTERSCCVVQ